VKYRWRDSNGDARGKIGYSYGFLARKKEMRKSEILSAGLSIAVYLLLVCFSNPAPANEAI
jgi:hypothetical protein